MGTECQKDYSDEDQQLLDEAEGRECGLPAGVIEREMPAIQAGLEARTVELLQENVRNSQERLNEARTLSAEGSRAGKEEWETKLEELDHGRWPSDKESRDTYHAGRELGIREWSCASLPPITGLGLKDMQPHINETIKVLSQNEKLWEYRQLWTGAFANKIMFADREALRKEGIKVPDDVQAYTFRATSLVKDLNLPQTIFIFNEPTEGNDPTVKFPKGDTLLHYLAHEIAHCNEHFEEGEVKVEGKSMGWFKPVVGNEIEWQAAVEAQVSNKGLPEIAHINHEAYVEKLREKQDSPDLVVEPWENPHVVHEHFAAWVIDSPDLCDEMRQFFDEYMPKAFGE